MIKSYMNSRGIIQSVEATIIRHGIRFVDMSRYPRGARGSRIKCIECNAPTTETVDNDFVCVECGRNVIAQTTHLSQASGD
jgi:LSD1 subclass zinc finger protein